MNVKVTQVNISQDGAKVASKWQIEYVKLDSKNETETWTINKWVDKEVVELKSTRKLKDGKDGKYLIWHAVLQLGLFISSKRVLRFF